MDIEYNIFNIFILLVTLSYIYFYSLLEDVEEQQKIENVETELNKIKMGN
jgi:hypothetical protein